MHELSIATEIVSVVTGKLAEYPGAKVKAVKLTIGIHAGIEVETLSFCFPLAAQETAVAGAKLLIKTMPLSIDCGVCHGRFETETLKCPHCGASEVVIVGGRELDITSIDLELPEEKRNLDEEEHTAQE